MNPDDLKQAWQTQPSRTLLTIDAELLLKEVQRNEQYRATSESAAEKQSVAEAFATSVLWGGTIGAVPSEGVGEAFTGAGVVLQFGHTEIGVLIGPYSAGNRPHQHLRGVTPAPEKSAALLGAQ